MRSRSLDIWMVTLLLVMLLLTIQNVVFQYHNHRLLRDVRDSVRDRQRDPAVNLGQAPAQPPSAAPLASAPGDQAQAAAPTPPTGSAPPPPPEGIPAKPAPAPAPGSHSREGGDRAALASALRAATQRSAAAAADNTSNPSDEDTAAPRSSLQPPSPSMMGTDTAAPPSPENTTAGSTSPTASTGAAEAGSTSAAASPGPSDASTDAAPAGLAAGTSSDPQSIGDAGDQTSQEWQAYGDLVVNDIRNLLAGRYDEVIQRLSPELAARLTRPAIARALDPVRARHGTIENLPDGRPAVERLSAGQIVFKVAAEMADGHRLLFSITLDPEQRISGLMMK